MCCGRASACSELYSKFKIDAMAEGGERRAIPIDRVNSVLQIIDSGEPLKKGKAVFLLLVATELESVTTVWVGVHSHEAMREPMSSLGPSPDILDQRQKFIGVGVQRA